MSVEEEVELRDLVAQTLESNGCLAKLRAQLRASIFLALDEDLKVSKQQPLINNRIKTYLETAEGQVMFCIIREFLEFFNLYFTISVYEQESYLGNAYQYEGRQKIAKELGLDNLEDTTVPLLQQLIKIAQAKAKIIDINLNLNGSVDNSKESFGHDVEASTVKTDFNNKNSNASNFNNSHRKEENPVRDQNLNISKHEQLNATFDLTSPTVNISNLRRFNVANSENEKSNSIQSTKKNEDDDTYEDTSSIAEDSVALVNSKVPEQSLNEGEISNDDTLNETEFSQPILKESKLKSELDKSKLSPQKPDKLKQKASLSSLSDLPPLQMNKSRVNDILPSLYSKEFKEKSNLKELDKLFDMQAEYEEDFICSGDDYLKSGQSKISLLDEASINKSLQSPDKFPTFVKMDLKNSNRIISDCNKPSFKPLVSQKVISKEATNESLDNGKSEHSCSSSISENLGINASGSD